MTRFQHRRTLGLLIFAAIVAMLPNSILFPASHDIANHLHVPLSFIGLMVSFYSVAYVISTPFLGVLSDHVGRRPVLAGGLAVFSVGGVVPLFTANTGAILLGRAIMGIGSAGILPMVDSIIGDTFAAGNERRAALASFAATIAVADALVPFLGGLIDFIAWRFVFAVYLLGMLAALLCIWMLEEHAGHVERISWGAYLDSLRVACQIPTLIVTLICTVLFGCVYFGICALLPLALSKTSSGLMNGMLFLPIGVSWVTTSAWLARRPHLTHVNRFCLVIGLPLCVATAGLAFMHAILPLLVIALAWGVGAGVLTTFYSWVIGDESPETVRGAMNAVYNAAYVLGFSVGAPLFLWLRQQWSFTVSALVAAAAVLGMSLMAYRFIRLRQHSVTESQALDQSAIV